MLEEPRALEALARLPLPPPLKPPPPPPRLLCDTLRLPTRSPPPPPPRLPEPKLLEPALRLDAPAPPPRVALFDPRDRLSLCRLRACCCRADAESPRAPPPYLLAVARSPYGAPPRFFELCCHWLFPLRLTLLVRLLLRLKLLLLLIVISLWPPPQPQPYPQPPLIAAPHAMPMPKLKSAAPGV